MLNAILLQNLTEIINNQHLVHTSINVVKGPSREKRIQSKEPKFTSISKYESSSL